MENKRGEKPEIKVIFVGNKQTEKEFWDYYINLCIEEFLRRVEEETKKKLEKLESSNLTSSDDENRNEKKIKETKEKIRRYEKELDELLTKYPIAQDSEKLKLKIRIKNVKWAINKNKKILEKIEGSKANMEGDF